MIHIVRGYPLDAWHIYLEKNAEATFYHTPEWKDILERTFRYQSEYLFATNDSGDLIGLLPLFRVRSRLTGDRLSCIPFAHECGPLGTAEAKNVLIGEAVQMVSDLGIEFLEIKDTIPLKGFVSVTNFSTFLIELPPHTDQLWQNMSQKIRYGIKRASVHGIQVDISEDPIDVRRYYELNCLTKRRIGVPSHPLEFFENLVKFMKPNIRIYEAKKNNEVLASGVMITYKNYILYAYAASNPKTTNLNPNYALIWRCLEDAIRDGSSIFDFGRTSYENTGGRQFKKKWGTKEKKIYYSYYPQPRYVHRNGNMAKISSAIIPRMPMVVYRKFSDATFGNFG